MVSITTDLEETSGTFTKSQNRNNRIYFFPGYNFIVMLNLVIFGPPGSGKGTQSANIVRKYNLLHLSTGELLRQEMEKDTPLGREVSKFIDQGLLVPDDIVWRELYEYVIGAYGCARFYF